MVEEKHHPYDEHLLKFTEHFYSLLNRSKVTFQIKISFVVKARSLPHLELYAGVELLLSSSSHYLFYIFFNLMSAKKKKLELERHNDTIQTHIWSNEHIKPWTSLLVDTCKDTANAMAKWWINGRCIQTYLNPFQYTQVSFSDIFTNFAHLLNLATTKKTYIKSGECTLQFIEMLLTLKYIYFLSLRMLLYANFSFFYSM